jgi:hypothetical protein
MVAVTAGMVLMVWLAPATWDLDIAALPVALMLPVAAIVSFERALAGPTHARDAA